MTALKLYILRLLIGSILCATVLCLVEKKQYEAFLRSLCGIILMLLLLNPLNDIRWNLDWNFLEESVLDGQLYSAQGTSMARQEQIQRISEALEAYILEKAAQEELSLTAEVSVREALTPDHVVIHGEVDQDTKQYLTEIIEKELGIAKENQFWDG